MRRYLPRGSHPTGRHGPARRRSRFGSLLAGSLLVVATTACEPPPPRLQLTVTSLGSGGDTDPGDGICQVTSPVPPGGCTLRAAIEEANATPNGVDILLPSGPIGNVTATITGDVVLKPASAGRALLAGVRLTIASGAQVRAERLETATGPGDFQVNFDVHGSLVLDRSLIISAAPTWTGPPPHPAVRIRTGGTAWLQDSVAISDAPDGTIANEGTLLALRSTLSGTQGCPECQARALVTGVGAVSHLQSTGLHTTLGATGYSACAGVPPVSHGYVHVEEPCGSAPATGDSAGPAGWSIDPGNRLVTIASTSPLVDAVPLGTPGCEISAVDLVGAPRGVDGNGDGIGGCDIGAIERQP